MTSSIAVSVSRCPSKRQGRFLQFPEIAQSQNSRCVVLGIDNYETVRISCIMPRWIGIKIDIAFIILF